MGSRPSSRRAAIRLTRLVPNRCRPTATSRRGSWGSLRFRHSGHLRAMKTCSVTSAGHTGSSMTSRVRCTQPPLRVVWHSGQDSGAWTTCRVAFIRGRAKLRGRFRRGFFSCSGSFLRLAAGLWPGIPPLGPAADSRASRLSTRCRSPALASRNSAITASRVSRLALVRSSPVSIVLLCHNHALGASVFQRDPGLAKFASSTLNSYPGGRDVDGGHLRHRR